MRHANKPTYSFVILTLVLIIIDTLLAWLSISIFPTVAGGIVSWIYVAVAFMILFTLWFGFYGAIAAYVGTLVGSGLLVSESLTQHPEIALIWALAGLFQVLIPLAAVRNFDVDLEMKNPRDYTYIILFGVVINNLIGGAWAAWSLSLVETVNMVSVFTAWFIGNAVVCLIILPLGLKFLTEKAAKSPLFIRKYWD